MRVDGGYGLQSKVGGAIVLATVVPTVLAADPTDAVTAAFDRFQDACETALTDPQAYIASLTLPGPSGEAGIYQSPDKHYLLVYTAQSEGVTDRVEIATIAERQQHSCSIEAILPDFPEGPVIATSLKPLLAQRAKNFVGGLTPNISPIWEPGGDEPLAYEGDPWHVYRATGLIAGIDEISTILVQSGSLSFSVSRVVEGETE